MVFLYSEYNNLSFKKLVLLGIESRALCLLGSLPLSYNHKRWCCVVCLIFELFGAHRVGSWLSHSPVCPKQLAQCLISNSCSKVLVEWVVRCVDWWMVEHFLSSASFYNIHTHRSTQQAPLYFYFLVLDIKHRTSHMLSTCFLSELHPYLRLPVSSRTGLGLGPSLVGFIAGITPLEALTMIPFERRP